MARRFALLVALLVAFSPAWRAQAANDIWDGNGAAPPNGNWETALNWADNTTPGNADTATFNLAQTYAVTFGAAPLAIQGLTASAGDVTLLSSGGVKTLNINSASGGQDLSVTGAGVELILGNSAATAVNLVIGDDLSVQSGGSLLARFGSDVAASDLSATGLNGTITMDGAGSTLTLSGVGISNFVGRSGGTGALALTGGTTANSIAGHLGIADSNVASTVGSVTIQGGSILSLVGNLTMANQNAAGQSATLDISGAGSTLSQAGASTVTFGSALNGTATVNIGTLATGGTLTTGAGQITINKTATVTIGSGAFTGTLNANGDVLLDGGVIDHDAGAFNLGGGRNFTAQNNGNFSFTGSYTVNGGSHYLIQSGADFSTTAGLSIGSSTSGAMTVDGATSTLAMGNLSIMTAGVGPGLTGTLTLSNGAVATQSGVSLSIGQTALANTAVLNVQSGATLNSSATSFTIQSSGRLDISGGGIVNASGNLNVNSAGGTGGATPGAVVNLTGFGSAFTQTGASTITVGHATTGTGEINLGVGASTLTTGTGQLTINPTGSINMTSGTINANGNVLIDGGSFLTSNGQFILAAGKTMTIQNGGSFSHGFYSTTGATYTITGAGSKLEMTDLGDGLVIRNGASVNVEAGGLLSSAGSLHIGNTTNGTLTVDGTGGSSTVDIANFSSAWGGFGATANVTFRNGAIGTFGGLDLADDAAAGSTAIVSVESGAALTIGRLDVAQLSTSTSATINVQGTGSSITQTGSNVMNLGTLGGLGDHNVDINIGTTASGGVVTTGTGQITISRSATVTIGNGAFSGTLNANGDVLVDGGVIDHNAGTFTLAAGKNFTARNDANVSFTGAQTINGGSTYLIQSGANFSATSSLTIGSAATGALTVDGTIFSGASTASASSANWGTLGGTANVTFSNNATGDFGAVAVANNFTAGTTATVNIQSGADLALGSLSVASQGGGSTSGSVTIDGLGTTATQSGALTVVVGHSTTGVGTLTLSNAAAFTAGTGQTTVSSTGKLDVLSGSAYTTGGNVAVNSTGGAGGAGARLNINGASSTFTQFGATTITVGHATTGTGAINIGTTATGGTLDTGTGLFTINPTGAVNIGSGANAGTLLADGNVTINGGVLARGPGSTFTLAAGKTLVIQNGGRASFNGSYATSGATYTITGPGSRLETLGLTDEVKIVNGAAVSVQAGGLLSSLSTLIVGDATTGSLAVDGAGGASSVEVLSITQVGINGAAGTLSLSNAATGAVGLLFVGPSSAAGTAGTVNVESDADLIISSLEMGTFGGASTSAILNIQGSGSTVMQPSGTTTVGHGATGTAVVNIGTVTSNATFTSSTGAITINKTGVVNIGSGATTGRLNANGDVTIDGGVLEMGAGSTFSLAAGKTMTVENGGRATVNGAFGNQFSTADNAIYNITGADSRLETTATSLGVTIFNGAEMNISAGGVLSSAAIVSVGTSGTGTLTVDGPGSSAIAAPASNTNWGLLGGTANVAFRNNATGSFGALRLADNTIAGTTAVVNVESGSELNIGGVFFLASVGGATTSATLNIAGSGASVIVGGVTTFGHPASGEAVVNVEDGGVFTINSLLHFMSTAKLNINGGTVSLGNLNDLGGEINFNAGSLSYIGNLTVGTGGILGTNLALNADRRLTLSGTTTIDAGRDLTLAGGTLNTGTLVVNGAFNFIAGTLGITQAGASINAPLVTGNPTTINVSANNVALGSAASLTGFHHQGVLNVDANTVTLNSAGYAQLGVLTSLAGGAINAANGVYLSGGGNLSGNGAVNARFTGDAGSVIDAGGALALGDSASPAGFNFDGELRTRQHAVTLRSSAQATLGNLTTLGSGANPGTLNVANGAIVDFGDAITGFGTVSSTNTLAKRSIINGIAQGNSVAQPLTFTGHVKGVGTFDNVSFAGTFDPGLSATILTAGNLAFSATSTLLMELGGVAPGAGYDQIQASGALALDGALQIALINGFAPQAGDTFDLFNWGSLSGTFDAMTLPAINVGLRWDASQLYTTGLLSVAPAFEADFDEDGNVDAQDLVQWKGDFNLNGDSDADADGDADGADFLTWQRQLGSGSLLAATTVVPEPMSGTMLLAGVLALAAATRRLRK